MIAGIQRGFAGAFGGNGRRSKNIAVVGDWGVGSIHKKSKGQQAARHARAAGLGTTGGGVSVASFRDVSSQKQWGGIRMHREKKGETK